MSLYVPFCCLVSHYKKYLLINVKVWKILEIKRLFLENMQLEMVQEKFYNNSANFYKLALTYYMKPASQLPKSLLIYLQSKISNMQFFTINRDKVSTRKLQESPRQYIARVHRHYCSQEVTFSALEAIFPFINLEHQAI